MDESRNAVRSPAPSSPQRELSIRDKAEIARFVRVPYEAFERLLGVVELCGFELHQKLGVNAVDLSDDAAVSEKAESGSTPRQKLRDAAFRHSMDATNELAALESENAKLRSKLEQGHIAYHELSHELAELRRERDEAQRQIDITQLALDDTEQHLGNLLAVIHRDGGHYRTEYGTKKAVAEAHKIWARLQQERDEAVRAEREACAQIVIHNRGNRPETFNDLRDDLAAAIRARGEGG